MLIHVMVYMWYKDLNKDLTSWDFKETFKGWGEIIWLSVAGIAMYILEWWSFESTTIFAGALGGDHLAAHITLITTYELMENITLGVASATTTLVGNKIGKN
mmetsp:Transcript_30704/g.5541  ORF Transcript_30704/g.5541 Transcript_30704/m.5541 type:complete len:102 (+) Transcript_30704:591-896(+)